MGCLRSGCYFIASLFVAVFFTVVLAFIGAVVTLFSSGGIQGSDFSSLVDTIQANPTGVLIGGGIGALIGLSVMIRMMRRASDITWLKRYGTRITATVTKIEKKSESYRSGNTTQYRIYYVVVATWTHPQTRQIHTFHSDHRSFKPKKYAPGSGISVLIDPQSLQRYLVEV